MATQAGVAYVTIAYDPAGIQKMRAATAAEGKHLSGQWASNATRVGGTLTRALTLPILAAGAAATKYTYDFEQSLNHIQSLVGVGTHQMDVYRQAILKLSPAVGQGPKALADALYFITSSGYKGAAAIDVLTASAKGAASGLGDTKTIADLVTSAVTVYGQKNLSASKAVDILTQAVKDGKGEPAQYATELARVIPVANALGVSFDQASAAIASLTLSGFSVDKASTGLASIFTNLSKTSKGADAELKRVGLSAAGIRQEIKDKGLLPALQDLAKAEGGNAVNLRKIFTSGKAIVPFLALTGQGAGKASKTFKDLANSTGASNKAFQTQSTTTAFKVQQSMARIQVAAVQTGGVLLPIFATVAESIGNLAGGFGKLPQAGQQAIIFGGLAVAALGPIISVAGNVAKAVNAIKFASAASGLTKFLTASAGFGPWGIAFGLAAAAVVVGVTAILRGNQKAGKSFADVRAEIQKTTDAYHAFHDAVFAQKNAKLGQAEARLAFDEARKTLAQLPASAKGTLVYRSAVLGLRRAKLDLSAANTNLAHTEGDTARAAKKATDQAKTAQSDYNGVMKQASKILGQFTHAQFQDSTSKTVQAEIIDRLTKDLNKNASALDAAANKVAPFNKQLAAQERQAARSARATAILTRELGHLPTNQQIALYLKEHPNDIRLRAQAIKAELATFKDKTVNLTVKFLQTGVIPTPSLLPPTTKPKPAPPTATGGIVTSPQVRLVGEAGPEAIIPLSQGGIGLGGPMYFDIHIGGEKIAEHVQAQLRKTSRTLKAGKAWAH